MKNNKTNERTTFGGMSMTEEQIKINKELSEMRKKFLKKYNISCTTCTHHTETNRCTSKINCIVREQVFISPYKKKE